MIWVAGTVRRLIPMASRSTSPDSTLFRSDIRRLRCTRCMVIETNANMASKAPITMRKNAHSGGISDSS